MDATETKNSLCVLFARSLSLALILSHSVSVCLSHSFQPNHTTMCRSVYWVLYVCLWVERKKALSSKSARVLRLVYQVALKCSPDKTEKTRCAYLVQSFCCVLYYFSVVVVVFFSLLLYDYCCCCDLHCCYILPFCESEREIECVCVCIRVV